MNVLISDPTATAAALQLAQLQQQAAASAVPALVTPKEGNPKSNQSIKFLKSSNHLILILHPILIFDLSKNSLQKRTEIDEKSSLVQYSSLFLLTLSSSVSSNSAFLAFIV